MKTGIKKVVFYDPSTGDAVQINKVSQDSTVKIKEPFTTEAADGTLVYAGDDSALEIKAFEELPTQLTDWMDDETELRAVVYGVDAHVLWNESAPITVKKNLETAPGNRNGYTVTMERKGGSHDIAVGNNLLYIANGWADGDSDGIADNYTLGDHDTSPTPTFSGGVQTLTGVGVDFYEYADVVFPISGASLNFFSNIGGSAAQPIGSLEINQYSFGGTLLSTTTVDSDETASFETASGVYRIECAIVTSGNLGAGETATFELPYLGNKTSGKINY